jgi:hypothetical protein
VAHKSAALAAENFMISMAAINYDSCDGRLDSLRVKKILKLPQSSEINMVIACGLKMKGFTETVLEYHLKKFILNFKPSQLIIITKMNLQNRIEEIKANGYQLDFPTFSILRSKITKKIALYGFLILVFYFVIFAIMATIIISVFGIATLTTMLSPKI